MCSYGECLEQVQVTKALSFSCNNSVRMNSTTRVSSLEIELESTSRRRPSQSELGHWHVSHRFTASGSAVRLQVTATRLPRDRIQASSGSMR